MCINTTNNNRVNAIYTLYSQYLHTPQIVTFIYSNKINVKCICI
jgi:hypothetical protein